MSAVKDLLGKADTKKVRLCCISITMLTVFASYCIEQKLLLAHTCLECVNQQYTQNTSKPYKLFKTSQKSTRHLLKYNRKSSLEQRKVYGYYAFWSHHQT